MKSISSTDILAVGKAMNNLKQIVDLGDGEKMARAIRAGCDGADIHLKCSYPDCACKNTPKIVRAALLEWTGK